MSRCDHGVRLESICRECEPLTDEDLERARQEGYEAGWSDAMPRAAEVCEAEARQAARTIRSLADRSQPS